MVTPWPVIGQCELAQRVVGEMAYRGAGEPRYGLEGEQRNWSDRRRGRPGASPGYPASPILYFSRR